MTRFWRKPWEKYRGRIIGYASAVASALIIVISVLSTAPGDFPAGEVVKIRQGTYLSQAAGTLASNDVIRSQFIFKVYVLLMSGHRQIQAGDYRFDEPQSALRVAYRMVNGDLGMPKIKVRLTEGLTSSDIGAILAKNISGFDKQSFLTLSKPYEGTLFPDTYFFYPTSDPSDVVDQLRATFMEKVKPLLLDVQASGHSLEDIVTMASIVEREATSTEDREVIAGILWNRIKINMPLQVDPPFYYLLGKDSAHLTMSDLAIDSPYNLYKHTGLPPTPIDNPGLDAITATLHPAKTDYLYFLSGRNGRTYYAATLEEHIANRQKYL